MNPFLSVLLVLLPIALIMGFAFYLARQSANGMPVKRTLALNLTAFLVVLLIAGCFAFAVSAEDPATVMTAAEKAASNESMGLGLLAAAWPWPPAPLPPLRRPARTPRALVRA